MIFKLSMNLKPQQSSFEAKISEPVRPSNPMPRKQTWELILLDY